MINQMSLFPVRPAHGPETVEQAGGTPAEMTRSFGDYLQQALNGVGAMEQNASAVTDRFMLGQADVSDVMIASQQAELSLALTSQVRNKVIDAYQEIMRMQM
ncbi:flagellar hook-basal body complex protein FliE [Paenibacillus humicola]|uniref:flagellar hook-basal body complex protein FliE n=1 Tax=Paenibacillus humicola TaxID=3110540 RepID=UPI00237AC21F|nr:flagellar hook-basal body complex protein FliE [Paenibacillus humicola]